MFYLLFLVWRLWLSRYKHFYFFVIHISHLFFILSISIAFLILFMLVFVLTNFPTLSPVLWLNTFCSLPHLLSCFNDQWWCLSFLTFIDIFCIVLLASYLQYPFYVLTICVILIVNLLPIYSFYFFCNSHSFGSCPWLCAHVPLQMSVLWANSVYFGRRGEIKDQTSALSPFGKVRRTVPQGVEPLSTCCLFVTVHR